MLDIGAAGGIEPRWREVCSNINYIGVEADERSGNKLCVLEECRSTRYLQTFAWSKEEKINFNLCLKPEVSSVYQPNRILLEQYPMAKRFNVVEKQIINAEPLDKMADKVKIDFIKLDVQGGELNALKGSQKLLNDCLGLEIEVEFAELYENQPLFSDVNNYLIDRGFYFCDFIKLARWERVKLSHYGRCVWGEGLWLRNIESLDLNNIEETLKYTAICLLYGKIDEALYAIKKSGNNVPSDFTKLVVEEERHQQSVRSKFNMIQKIWLYLGNKKRIHLFD